MLYGGCDVGSTTGKMVVIDGEGRIVASSIVEAEVVCEDTAMLALKTALEGKELNQDDIAYTVGTGYGRVNVPFARENISEISCHALGAFSANPQIRTLIDVGGQDVKAIRVNERGGVEDFVMNDKCAAGTGSFLETTCRRLKVPIDQLGPLSLESKNPVKLSSQCSVFAQSEVVSLIAEKKALVDILAGINASITKRLVSMMHRISLEPEVAVSGGVAKNIGLCHMLEEKLGLKLASVDADPQLLGALGAALYARRRAERKADG